MWENRFEMAQAYYKEGRGKRSKVNKGNVYRMKDGKRETKKEVVECDVE